MPSANYCELLSTTANYGQPNTCISFIISPSSCYQTAVYSDFNKYCSICLPQRNAGFSKQLCAENLARDKEFAVVSCWDLQRNKKSVKQEICHGKKQYRIRNCCERNFVGLSINSVIMWDQ